MEILASGTGLIISLHGGTRYSELIAPLEEKMTTFNLCETSEHPDRFADIIRDFLLEVD